MAAITRNSMPIGLVAPTRTTSPSLQGPKQLHLRRCGQLADLVEEQRAAAGRLEVPLASPVGTGECALLVAEQFRFHELGREGAPQLTAMKGRSRRGLARWMALAINSLPVPVSPSMRTGTERGAMRRARRITRCMNAATMNDCVELGCFRGKTGTQAFQLTVRLTQKIGQVVRRDIERERRRCARRVASTTRSTRRGKRVFARMIHTAAMAGVPGLRWKVSEVSLALRDRAVSHARTAAV